MKSRKWLALQVAFTYIGTVVGAGFASGQEIVQFFTRFGVLGYAGIAITTVLLAWVGFRMMSLGHKLKAVSFRQLTEYLFGRVYANFIDALMFIVLFGVTVAMLAGTGALAQEQAGLPFSIGVMVTALVTCFTVTRGMKGILTANTFIVPLMILFTGLICASAWLRFHVVAVSAVAVELPSYEPRYPALWLVSSLSYAAFNLGLSVSVLIPLGGEIRDKKVLAWGAGLGAAGLGLMLAALQTTLLFSDSKVLAYDVPLGEIAHNIGGILQIGFLCVLWAEIYSTLIGNVYGLASQLTGKKAGRTFLLASAGILIAASALSHIGFSKLVAHVYPLFGYVCFFLVACLLIPFNRMRL